jgi:hypothetical protein
MSAIRRRDEQRIEAVDEHVMHVVVTAVARPIPNPPVDPVAAVGNRISAMIASEPEIAD